MLDVSPRLTRWVEAAFASEPAERVLAALRDLPDGVVGGQDPERVQASLVLAAAGSWDAFQLALAVAANDWRDALVGAGLGNADWPQRLDAALGAPQ
jgi:hypothetical protein